MSSYSFRLYVTGETTLSREAEANLRALCKDRLVDEFEIEIVDILEKPDIAEKEQHHRHPDHHEACSFTASARHRRSLSCGELRIGTGVAVHDRGSRRFYRDTCLASRIKKVASSERVTTGNAELDRMCGGGYYRDSAIIVSGPTGIGKTLIATQFVGAGVAQGELCLLFSFEESRDQLIRNAASWGLDLEMMERSGNLQIICEYPEMASLEDHFVRMKQAIEHDRPVRSAVDNLTALERVATVEGSETSSSE